MQFLRLESCTSKAWWLLCSLVIHRDCRARRKHRRICHLYNLSTIHRNQFAVASCPYKQVTRSAGNTFFGCIRMYLLTLAI